MTKHNRLAPGALYIGKKHPLTQEQWRQLGKELRIRWWTETDLDRRPPNDELMKAVTIQLKTIEK